MLKLILLLYYVQNTLIECAIYDYKVHKLDPSYIERKRKDTRDMCRIFAEGEQRMDPSSIHPDSILPGSIHTDSILPGSIHPGFQLNKSQTHTVKRRFKRGLSQGKLSLREAHRVENIVDKMYDDLTDDGKRVAYRKKVFTGKPTVKLSLNKSGRRFNFAPAALSGYSEPTKSTPKGEDHTNFPFQPWPKRWPLGIVPYYIDTKTYDNELLESIGRAFQYFERATCIRLQKLREKPIDHASLEQVEWIYIANPMGIRQCVHSNERKKNKGVQLVVLGYDCMSIGDILHEVMHVLGFPHEHTRPDRDNHITVLWDNIKPGYKKYFEIRHDDPLMTLPYDYASVLHYPPRAFSRNGQVTIRTKGEVKIGQRDGLSEIDVEKVSLVFGSECLKRNQQYLEKTCPNILGKNNSDHAVIPEDQIKQYFHKRLWPYGIVNYSIKDIMEFTVEERENIKNVLSHIEKETCLVFRNFTDDDSEEHVAPVPPIDPGQDVVFGPHLNSTANFEDVEYRRRSEIQPSRRHADHLITFVRSPANGCMCPVSGDLKDTYIVEITADCFNSANDLLHLVGHLLGLDHEHNMWDRDQFLTIIWDKLPLDVKKDLQDQKPPPASVGYEYDYQSVMHWPWLYLKDGATSIIYPNWNDGWSMGQWQGLSATDVKKLNHIYRNECEARQNLTTV